jgi:hypothetical protein
MPLRTEDSDMDTGYLVQLRGKAPGYLYRVTQDDQSGPLVRIVPVRAPSGSLLTTVIRDGGAVSVTVRRERCVPVYADDDALSGSVRVHANVAVDHLTGTLSARRVP